MLAFLRNHWSKTQKLLVSFVAFYAYEVWTLLILFGRSAFVWPCIIEKESMMPPLSYCRLKNPLLFAVRQTFCRILSFRFSFGFLKVFNLNC